jgi:hypothetical protein
MRKTQIGAVKAADGIYLTALPTFGGIKALEEGLSELISGTCNSVRDALLDDFGNAYTSRQKDAVKGAFDKSRDGFLKEVPADILSLGNRIQKDLKAIKL